MPFAKLKKLLKRVSNMNRYMAGDMACSKMMHMYDCTTTRPR